MASRRIERYLLAGTDSLSVDLPASSDRRVGIEGSPPGWLGTGYRGTVNVWPRRFGGPTSPSSGGPCAGGGEWVDFGDVPGLDGRVGAS
jgi:hypothetical protein